MTSPDWSKFKTKKRRKEPPRVPEPVRTYTRAEIAAFVAAREKTDDPREA